MSSTDQVREHIQNALKPHILPKDEVAYRRRILALHLGSCVNGGPVPEPLALVKPSRGIKASPQTQGLQKDFLRALEANATARGQLEELQRIVGSHSPSTDSRAQVREATSANPLEKHLTKIKLQEKQTRLQAVEKHINLLNQKPAASPSFLDPDEIFQDTRQLPDIPAEVVDGLVLNQDGDPGLKDLIDRLEKQVLKAKLLLKGEEQLLDAVKSRSTTRPDNITEDAKLAALSATRTELINWIDSELSKADAARDEGGEHNGSQDHDASVEREHIDNHLAGIREKYSQYLAARKSLIQLVGQKPQPTIVPLATTMDAQSDSSLPTPPSPATYLLTVHLESLLSVADEQKSLIAQKSHLNTTITKQLRETAKILNHLAEESHLLPAHPAAVARRKLPGVVGFDPSKPSSESLDACTKIKPWVSAADSAKIATLEVVAEKIEEGQVALEGSMGTLQGIEALLGRKKEEESTEDREGMEESDIWLAETGGFGRPGQMRRQDSGKVSNAKESEDLWAFLDGNLGGLKAVGEAA